MGACAKQIPIDEGEKAVVVIPTDVSRIVSSLPIEGGDPGSFDLDFHLSGVTHPAGDEANPAFGGIRPGVSPVLLS